MRRFCSVFWLILAMFLFALAAPLSPTYASDLVFQGQNAGLFPGANPSDTAQLMVGVPKPTAPTSTETPSQLIEQAVESQVSSQIFTDIFSGSAASGSFSLGNGSNISYVRADGNVTITITDPTNGTTIITVPDT
jgi:hypothetical protein